MKIFSFLLKHIPGIPGLGGVSSLLNPWVLLGVALGAGSVFGAGWHYGSAFCEGAHAKADLVAQRAVIAAYQAKATQYDVAASALEHARASRRVVKETITKEVDRVVQKPVYRNVCFDADGLRAANAALAGRAPDSGKSASTVPAAHAAR